MTDQQDLKREIAIAGAEMADLLSSSLLPQSGTWDQCRPPYIWEHNALCWLVRNRPMIPSMNGWTAKVLSDGYPFKSFIDAFGNRREAGAYWNAEMMPRGEEDEPAQGTSASG